MQLPTRALLQVLLPTWSLLPHLNFQVRRSKRLQQHPLLQQLRRLLLKESNTAEHICTQNKKSPLFHANKGGFFLKFLGF